MNSGSLSTVDFMSALVCWNTGVDLSTASLWNIAMEVWTLIRPCSVVRFAIRPTPRSGIKVMTNGGDPVSLEAIKDDKHDLLLMVRMLESRSLWQWRVLARKETPRFKENLEAVKAQKGLAMLEDYEGLAVLGSGLMTGDVEGSLSGMELEYCVKWDPNDHGLWGRVGKDHPRRGRVT